MTLALVLGVALVLVMARCAYEVLVSALIDRDVVGAVAMGIGTALAATGGILVLTNIGAWSQ